MLAIGVRRGSHVPESFDVPEPALRNGEVLVRTIRVGICGTDREILEGKAGHLPDDAEYLILGHEALGRVEAVGRGVDGLREGDLVVPSVRRARSGDHACRADFLDIDEYTERGIERAHGFAQELWVERGEYLTGVPEALEPIAVLAEPFSVVEKAINETLRIQAARLGDACRPPERTRALVVGPGPVGFAAAVACLARGFTLTMAGRDAETSPKVALARELGAEYVNASTTDFAALAASGRQWDLVVEAAGNGPLVFEVTKALAPRGAMALTGIAPDYEEELVDANRFLTESVVGNRLLIGSVNASMADFRDAIAHLSWANEQRPKQVRNLVNSRYPVADFAEAFADVLDKRRNPAGIKTVLEFG